MGIGCRVSFYFQRNIETNCIFIYSWFFVPFSNWQTSARICCFKFIALYLWFKRHLLDICKIFFSHGSHICHTLSPVVVTPTDFWATTIPQLSKVCESIDRWLHKYSMGSLTVRRPLGPVRKRMWKHWPIFNIEIWFPDTKQVRWWIYSWVTKSKGITTFLLWLFINQTHQMSYNASCNLPSTNFVFWVCTTMKPASK